LFFVVFLTIKILKIKTLGKYLPVSVVPKFLKVFQMYDRNEGNHHSQ